MAHIIGTDERSRYNSHTNVHHVHARERELLLLRESSTEFCGGVFSTQDIAACKHHVHRQIVHRLTVPEAQLC